MQSSRHLKFAILWRLRARSHEQMGNLDASAADLVRARELDEKVHLRRLERLAGKGRGALWPNMLELAEYKLRTLKDFEGAIKCGYALCRGWGMIN